MHAKAEKLLSDGIKELDRGNTRLALTHFEEAAELEDAPVICSYLAFCLAKERREFEKAILLCREAIRDDSANSLHYLNLGRVHLLCGDKKEAIRVFRDGLLRGENRQIKAELSRLGWRKVPVIPCLRREHFLNRYLGVFLTRCKIR